MTQLQQGCPHLIPQIVVQIHLTVFFLLSAFSQEKPSIIQLNFRTIGYLQVLTILEYPQ